MWVLSSQKGSQAGPGARGRGQEGAVGARILGQVGLRLGSEQAWGREGRRSGPMKHWDADLQLGRAGEDTRAQPWRP